MYIVFEGIVGSGKTTQSKKLYEHLKEKFPKKEIVWTREPGGTEIAEAIRKLVQGTPFKEDMEPICEAYLYAASRAQALRKVVRPVLKRKGIVISDRSFITSLAYQGVFRGLDVKIIWKINKTAVGKLIPDIVFYIETSVETALSRTEDKDEDKFEKEGIETFNKISRGYKEVSTMTNVAKKWINIDGSGTSEEVFERIRTHL